jgi:Tfp pilus assembly protein PilW
MIGMVIGLIVSGIALNLYLSTLNISTQTANTVRLNQEMRLIMDMMVSDIRRAGYGDTPDGVSVAYSSIVSGGVPISIFKDGGEDCLVISYNADSDADIELFAYKLASGTVRLSELSATSTSTASVNCSSFSVWENLSSTDISAFSALSFTSNAASSGWASTLPKVITVSLSASSAQDSKIFRQLIETVRVRNEY